MSDHDTASLPTCPRTGTAVQSMLVCYSSQAWCQLGLMSSITKAHLHARTTPVNSYLQVPTCPSCLLHHTSTTHQSVAFVWLEARPLDPCTHQEQNIARHATHARRLQVINDLQADLCSVHAAAGPCLDTYKTERTS